MRRIQKLAHESQYFVLIVPALILFALFVAYPVFSTVTRSFTNWSDVLLKDYKFVGLRNYTRLFRDGSTLIGIKVSFIYAICATLLQSAVGLTLAIALNTARKGRNILRALWYFPAVLSSLIIGYLFNFIFSTSDLGLLNQLIARVGLGKINFLGDPRNALTCIIAVSVWQWAGWTMTIYLANLQGIPAELYESAGMDGAGPRQQFLNVTLPMLFPAVSYTFVTGMINGLKVFDIIYALTSGGPNGQTESIVSLMMKRGFTEGFFAYACTMGTVFLVIVLIITAVQMRFFNKWGEGVS
jgi:raffinose/stachyose/melibiose transport system permease protein